MLATAKTLWGDASAEETRAPLPGPWPVHLLPEWVQGPCPSPARLRVLSAKLDKAVRGTDSSGASSNSCLSWGAAREHGGVGDSVQHRAIGKDVKQPGPRELRLRADERRGEGTA